MALLNPPRRTAAGVTPKTYYPANAAESIKTWLAARGVPPSWYRVAELENEVWIARVQPRSIVNRQRIGERAGSQCLK
jgi:hypothetical protein